MWSELSCTAQDVCSSWSLNIGRKRPSVIATTKNEPLHLQMLQEPALYQEPTGMVDTEVSGSGQQGKAVRTHRPGWEQGGVGGLPGTDCSERRSPWC